MNISESDDSGLGRERREVRSLVVYVSCAGSSVKDSPPLPLLQMDSSSRSSKSNNSNVSAILSSRDIKSSVTCRDVAEEEELGDRSENKEAWEPLLYF